MTEDRELLRLLQTEPEQGLRLALAQYGGLVKRIVLTVLPQADRRDMEECVADVFLRLYQSAGRYREGAPGGLKGYLCGIARHTAIDRGRRSYGLTVLPLSAGELGVSPDLAEKLEQREVTLAVQQAVLALQPPDKEIFIRRYFCNQRVAEIAGELGLDEKAVENRLYRGRKRLKQQLIEQGVTA